MENGPSSIVITGASSGIGAALALHYARPGVTLSLTGRNEARLSTLAQQCTARGAEIACAAIDVTDADAMADWLRARDEAREIDLVIANAGISGGTGGSALGEGAAQTREIFDVNVGGMLNTVLPILPLMTGRRRGQIALISSMAGFRGFPSAPAYSASKGAVRFYGEALRGALRPSGVRVNVICPGFVRSRITDANDFPMPMLMDADTAAAIIARGLSRDRGRIAFPWPIHLTSWALSVLPDILAQKILAKLPAKSAI